MIKSQVWQSEIDMRDERTVRLLFFDDLVEKVYLGKEIEEDASPLTVDDIRSAIRQVSEENEQAASILRPYAQDSGDAGADMVAALRGDVPLKRAFEALYLFVRASAMWTILQRDEVLVVVFSTRFGFTEVAEYLIERAASDEDRRPLLDAALINAIKAGNQDFFFRILSNWPPPAHRILNELAAAAVRNKRTPIAQYLIRRPEVDKALLFKIAAEVGNTEIVTTLLNADTIHGLDVTPELVLAAENGHVETARVLLDHGAFALDAFNPAASKGKTEILRLLLSVIPQVPFFFYHEAIELAARFNHPETMAFLLDQSGADINAVIIGPLEAAAENGHIEILQLMLERGARLDFNDDEAFVVAAENGHTDVVAWLYEHGFADVTIADAARLADQNGHPDTVMWLLEHGTDISALPEDRRARYRGKKQRTQTKKSGVIQGDINAPSTEIQQLLFFSDLVDQVRVTKEIAEDTSPLSLADIRAAIRQASEENEQTRTLLAPFLEPNDNATPYLALAIADDVPLKGAVDGLLLLIHEDGWTLTESDEWQVADVEDVFFDAARHGYLELIREIIRTNNYINYGPRYADAMEYAAKYGQTEVVRFFFERGGKRYPYAVAQSLASAAAAGHVDTVKFLLQHVTVTIQTEQLIEDALMNSARNGHADVVTALLDSSVRIEEYRFPWHALSQSALRGHKNVVLVFLGRSDLRWTVDDMFEALDLMTVSDDADIVRLILDRVTVFPEEQVNTVLAEAAREENIAVMTLLLDRAAVNQVELDIRRAVIAAAANNKIPSLQFMYDRNLTQDSYLTDALIWAADPWDEPTVRWLVEHGADPEEMPEGKARKAVLNWNNYRNKKQRTQTKKSGVSREDITANSEYTQRLLFFSDLVDQVRVTKEIADDMSPLSLADIRAAIRQASEENEQTRTLLAPFLEPNGNATSYLAGAVAGDVPLKGAVDGLLLLIHEDGWEMKQIDEWAAGQIDDTFFDAARHGYLDLIQEIIRTNNFIRYPPRYANAMEYAAKYGQTEVVKFLFESGGKRHPYVVAQSLASAAAAGHVDTVKFLLQHVTVTRETEQLIEDALVNAAKNDHADVVTALLDSTVRIEDGSYFKRLAYFALMQAALSGHKNVVLAFLGRNDLRWNVDDMFDAMNYAATGDHLEMVVFFLDRLGDVDADNRVISISIQRAIARGRHNMDIFNFFFDRFMPFSDAYLQRMMRWAGESKNKDVIQFLLDRTNVSPVPALAPAADDADIVRLILDRVTVFPEEEANAALAEAAKRGNIAVMTLLLDRAAVNQVELDIRQAVLKAAAFNKIPSLQFMYDRNLTQDSYLTDALIWRAEFLDERTLRWLVEHGADPEEMPEGDAREAVLNWNNYRIKRQRTRTKKSGVNLQNSYAAQTLPLDAPVRIGDAGEKGMGVFATRRIPFDGIPLGKYTGRFVTDEQDLDPNNAYVFDVYGYDTCLVNVRRPPNARPIFFIDSENDTYNADAVDVTISGRDYTADEQQPNWTRFVNSVLPTDDDAMQNCEFCENNGRIWLRTLRGIDEGEELLCNYGADYWQVALQGTSFINGSQNVPPNQLQRRMERFVVEAQRDTPQFFRWLLNPNYQVFFLFDEQRARDVAMVVVLQSTIEYADAIKVLNRDDILEYLVAFVDDVAMLNGHGPTLVVANGILPATSIERLGFALKVAGGVTTYERRLDTVSVREAYEDDLDFIFRANSSLYVECREIWNEFSAQRFVDEQRRYQAFVAQRGGHVIGLMIYEKLAHQLLAACIFPNASIVRGSVEVDRFVFNAIVDAYEAAVPFHSGVLTVFAFERQFAWLRERRYVMRPNLPNLIRSTTAFQRRRIVQKDVVDERRTVIELSDSDDDDEQPPQRKLRRRPSRPVFDDISEDTDDEMDTDVPVDQEYGKQRVRTYRTLKDLEAACASGGLVNVDARDGSRGLYVAGSNALGVLVPSLYATRAYAKGEFVTRYVGRVVFKVHPDVDRSQHVIQAFGQKDKVILGIASGARRSGPVGGASFVNDLSVDVDESVRRSREAGRILIVQKPNYAHNVDFVALTLASEYRAFATFGDDLKHVCMGVVALRNIEAGEELSADYGRAYWDTYVRNYLRLVPDEALTQLSRLRLT